MQEFGGWVEAHSIETKHAGHAKRLRIVKRGVRVLELFIGTLFTTIFANKMKMLLMSTIVAAVMGHGGGSGSGSRSVGLALRREPNVRIVNTGLE